MPPKHQLHQLLQEDQEPFRLRDYIADRKTKLRPLKNQLQVRKSSHVQQFPVTFCKNACFSGGKSSPDLIKSPSPVFHFPKSPAKILQIPSRTAALLLDAALRINHHSSKNHSRRHGTELGFFGSVLKKLAVKNPKLNIRGLDNFLRRDPSRNSASRSGEIKTDLMNSEEVLSDWSEDKSSLDTSTSCSSSNSDATRLPEFSLHPSSPHRSTVKNADGDEKEQCSPVCVLDPLSEDDDYEHETDYGLFGLIQRRKDQILHKLGRFEALADLNPKALEPIILEDENDDIGMEGSSVLQQVLEKCGFGDLRRVPIDTKILISDLITEEETKHDVVNEVCDKLESWKEVEQHTIDMMVDQDFRQVSDKWTRNQEQVTMVSMAMEEAIFSSLVGELLCEFCNPLDC